MFFKNSPQLTEQGDQSLQSVTAQCGSDTAAAGPLPAAEGAAPFEGKGQTGLRAPAHSVLFIVST